MEEDFPGLLDYLSGTQGLPTEQPVAMEPATASADFGGWSFDNFRQQYLAGQQALNDFNQYTANQAAQGNLVTSPIGDPLTLAMLPGLLNLYGSTPEEQALQYYNLQSRDTTVPIAFNPNEYGGGYQLVDGSGKVIASAASASELEAIIADAAGRTGAKDTYSIQGIRGNGDVETIYTQPQEETLGDMLVQMAAIALPAAGGAVLGPALAGTGALGIGVSPAVGIGLGTAVGSAAAGTAAGKSIEDILLQAAISGLAAGGAQALFGASPADAARVSGLAADLQTQVIDGTMSLADATRALANAGASQAALANFAADVGGTFASTTPTVIGTIANAASSAAPVIAGATGGVLGAVAGAQPGTTVIARTDDVANIIRNNPGISVTDPLLSQFTSDEIADAAKQVQSEQAGTTVMASQPAVTPPTAVLPPPGTTVTAPTTTTTATDTSAPPSVLPPPGTTVTAPTTTTTATDTSAPPSVLPPPGTTVTAPTTTTTATDTSAPPSVLPPPGTTVTAPTTTTTATDTSAPPSVLPPPGTTVTAPPDEPPYNLTEEDIATLPIGTTLAPDTSKFDLNEDNFWKDLLKYYAVASGAADLLKGAGGSGGTGSTTPYTSLLGPAPTFGRGAFQPFTGDYEQYGFGPEWSFFAPQPAPTTTNVPFPFLLPSSNTGG